MIPRWLYVATLGVAVGGLMFAASIGEGVVVWLAYAVAVGLGAVTFYQGEARVTRGPIVANVGIGLVLGVAVAVLLTAGLLIAVIEASWDLALWQGGLRVWSDTIGVGFAFTTAFFVVGTVASLR